MEVRRILFIITVILSVMFAGISLSLVAAHDDNLIHKKINHLPALKEPPLPLVNIAVTQIIPWNSEKSVQATVKSEHYLDVVTEAQGDITQVAAAGSRVKKGDLLFHLDTRAEAAAIKWKEAQFSLCPDRCQES